MKRLVVFLAFFVLIAAAPQDALPDLEADGYYIEEGSSATEELVSDAVFEGRADGGRLYLVVLAEEPPGGATTFSDSTLDLLDGDGYVVTVAPETVGFAGDGTAWTVDEVNRAIDESLSGGSDDEVVELFITALTGASFGGEASAPGGGIPFGWILLIGGVAVVVWVFVSRRRQTQQVAGRMEEVRQMAREKLDEVANDILEMEDEVAVSDDPEVAEHYQRASVMYSKAMEDNQRASTVREMLEVSEELDLAIWELDCAEALLDGKPKPTKPEPAQEKVEMPSPVPEDHVAEGPGHSGGEFDRRPQRHSTSSNDVMTMLMTMMAMGGMRGSRGGGFGGFGGPGRGGGGSPMGGGRIRGGGRRRG